MASVTKFYMQRIGRWRLKAAVSGQKDRYRILPAGTTEGQADGLRATWLAEIEAGRDKAPPASPRVHLGPFLESHAALQSHLAPATRARYAEFRRHLGPLANRQLAAITLADAAELQRRLLETKVSKQKTMHPNTVRQVYQYIHTVLAEAVRQGVLTADPWQLARGVRAPRRKRHIPDPRDTAERLETIPGRVGALLRLALATGCRRGELLALTWRDIDGATLRVSKGLVDGRGGATVQPPKTESSHRTIALAAHTVHELATLRLEAATRAQAAGVPLESLPVLPGDDGGYWRPRAAGKAAMRALHRAGIPVSLHAMRHSSATALLSIGVNPATVQARLGHSSMSTTLGTYAHAVPHDDARAAEALGTFISRASIGAA